RPRRAPRRRCPHARARSAGGPGRFSTLIASAGRCGICPWGACWPVSGQVGGGGGVLPIPTFRASVWMVAGARPVSTRYPSTPVATSTITELAAVHFPRRVSDKGRTSSGHRLLLRAERSGGPVGGPGADATGGSGDSQRTRRESSHLLQTPDAVLDRRVRGGQLLPRA